MSGEKEREAELAAATKKPSIISAVEFRGLVKQFATISAGGKADSDAATS